MEEKVIAYNITNIQRDVETSFTMASHDINRKHGYVVTVEDRDRISFTVTHMDEKNISVCLSPPKKLSGNDKLSTKLFHRGVKMYLKTQIYNYAGVFW